MTSLPRTTQMWLCLLCFFVRLFLSSNWPVYPLCVAADSTGTHSLYTTYKDYELMFHVSTMLPYTPNNRQQVSKLSHGGPEAPLNLFLWSPPEVHFPLGNKPSVESMHIVMVTAPHGRILINASPGAGANMELVETLALCVRWSWRAADAWYSHDEKSSPSPSWRVSFLEVPVVPIIKRLGPTLRRWQQGWMPKKYASLRPDARKSTAKA